MLPGSSEGLGIGLPTPAAIDVASPHQGFGVQGQGASVRGKAEKGATDSVTGNAKSIGAAPPIRLIVEAAAIDVAILPLMPSQQAVTDQAIVPPSTEDGYWLASYGQPGQGSTNTTYLTGHSWEGREAPFNRLSTHTSVGDTITLETETGSLAYVVDSISTQDKNSLKDSEIWNIVPNKLVIVSCYTEDLWGKNVVVTASPVA